MNDCFSHLRDQDTLEKVLVVSKTKMKNHVCVGGILENGTSVRLLSGPSLNQPIETNISVGDYYIINYENGNKFKLPHSEDVLVNDHYYQNSCVDMYDELQLLLSSGKVKAQKCFLRDIFDSNITWGFGGSGFLGSKGSIPNYSTCFWLSNETLYKINVNGNCYYQSSDKKIKIKHVGYQCETDEINIGSIVRFSLARWWSKDNTEDKRCYLQLSGWFN